MNAQDIFHTKGPLGGDRAEVQFSGTLQGRPVVWDAVICTCARYLRECPESPPRRHRIDLGPPGPGGHTLLVVLDLPCIDTPAVRKTVLMIRQWKRLAPGRHDYG